MNDIECPVVKSNSVCYWKDMWRKLDRMRQLWQLCDVSLVTEDKRMFMAHSPVLAASSNFFHELLIRQNFPGMSEDNCRKLFLDRINSDVLEVTLNFIYGITPSTRQDFQRLQIGAKELRIVGAYEYCSQHLQKLTLETQALKGANGLLPTEVSYGSQGENLSSYAGPLDLPPQLNCKETETSLGINRQNKLSEGSTDIVVWPVNRCEAFPETERTSEGLCKSESHHSVCALPAERHNSQLDVSGEMPNDEIHAGVFTQMSLVDLTAGIKCPHIKGIIGEDNPMQSFLGEDDLVNEVIKPQSPEECGSDFDEVPSLDERRVDSSSLMPLKKRKRMSPDEELNCVEEDKSKARHNNVSEMDFLSVSETKASDSSQGASLYSTPGEGFGREICRSSASFLNACDSTSSFPVEMTAEHIAAMKTSSMLKTCQSEFLKSSSEESKLLSGVNQRASSCETLPGCGSFLYPCASVKNRLYQNLGSYGESDLGFTSPSPSPKQLLGGGVCSYSMEMVRCGGVSDALLMTQTPPVFSAPSVSSSVAPSDCLQFFGQQQGPESAWKDSGMWNLPFLKPGLSESSEFLNSRKRSNWETVSNLEGFCGHNPSQDSALTTASLSSLCSTSASSKAGLHITSDGTPHQIGSAETLSTFPNVGCTVSADNGELYSFTVLGPSQGIVPSSLIRSQPIEICPSVADVSIPVSAMDGPFLKDKCMTETTKNAQRNYLSPSPEPRSDDSPTKLDKYHCSMCDKAFKTASQLNGHKRQTHCQKDVSVVSASAAIKPAVAHQCQYCQESFKSSYKLQTHQLKVHSKGKLFSCQDCSFRSPRKKDVQAHMLSQHGRAPSGVKVYSCSSCSYKCIDRNRFEEHEAKHTGITRHCCPLCNRAYTTKRGMRTHLKYHSDERPHKCNICGAAFKVTSKLSDHMKLIHLQKGVKPYKCGYCDHATALRGNCNQHIRKNHPGQPLNVIDKFASQRKCVKDYDYAGMAGDGIEEHRDLEAARSNIRTNKAAVA